MKISEYIKYLQELKNKHGDVDVKVNITYEWHDLCINNTFKEPELPYYDKYKKCYVIYSDFVSYE